jgi:glycerate 2-kinase
MSPDELQLRAERLRDDIVRAVLAAADPSEAVARAPLPGGFRPVVLLATGKASAPMVEAALERFPASISRGCVTSVPQHEERLRDACRAHPGIEIHPADHPLATERNRVAARTLADAARAAGESDAEVLVLLSGGASAHLTSPAGGLTLEDLRRTTEALLRAGATIGELNTVRKHIETLKGGRLARLLVPARTQVLVLSDVLGDPLDTIGSGPTAPDPTTLADARAVLARYPQAPIPPAVHRFLDDAGPDDETPKTGDPCFRTLTHAIIANNDAARHAAGEACETAGLPVVENRGRVTGEAGDVARELVRRLDHERPPCAVVFGGETTVTVGNATGLGGRNQELALAAAIELEAIPDALVLTLATDGIDGPTDAAGALVTTKTAAKIRERGSDPAEAMSRHDSHHALDAVGALIRTGPTGTNVNDVAVAIRF